MRTRPLAPPEPTTRLLIALAAAAIALPRGAVSAEMLPRTDHGARLEPRGALLHGGGQDPSGFSSYWNVVGEGARPAFLMAYLPLNGAQDGALAGLSSELQGYERLGVHLMLQLGLSMATDGTPSLHYEGRVASGEYDMLIESLCDELELLGHPVLLRIGYEFNGTAWNGYQPATYVAAFRRVAARIRERRLDVATVWDAAGEPDFLRGYMDYYPGDEYVDWWGLNLYSGPKGSSSDGFFSNPAIQQFLDAAEEHHKPVLIGEAAPRYTGVGAGEKSWDLWFAGFFDLVAGHPGIKAISYIDWNFAKTTQWNDWGDARLERDPVVAARYRAIVSAPPFLGGTSKEKLRAALGPPAATKRDSPSPTAEPAPKAPAAPSETPPSPRN